MKHMVSTAEAPAAIGPYSQALEVHGVLYLSGQIPLDPTTSQLVAGGIDAQTTQVLDNLGAVLAAANLGFEHVVKTTIYLVDLADFTRVNELYGKRFHRVPPARSTVQVSALPRGARVEIDAIAVRPRGP